MTPYLVNTPPAKAADEVHVDARYVPQLTQWAAYINNANVFNCGYGHHPITIGSVLDRLDAQAANFDNYRITAARVTYIPETPTTTPGNVTISYEPNPQGKMPVTTKEMLQNEASATGSCWSSWSMQIPLRKSWKNTIPQFADRPDPRCDFGQIAYVCTTPYTGAAADITRVGTFYLDYVVEFSNPGALQTVTKRAL